MESVGFADPVDVAGHRRSPVRLRRWARCRAHPRESATDGYPDGRYYDPATSQFLSVDPLVNITQQPYNYADDNPANLSDPNGLGPQLEYCTGTTPPPAGETQTQACQIQEKSTWGYVPNSGGPGPDLCPASILGAISNWIAQTRAAANLNPAWQGLTGQVNKLPGASWVNNNITPACIAQGSALGGATIISGGADALFLALRGFLSLGEATAGAGGAGFAIGCATPPTPPS